MIKNECDIVKDLLPSYIDGNLSDISKEFVDSHIKTCKYCKETLNMLKNGEEIEEAKKQAEDNAEIDYLKKYNRKINILKILSSLLAVFIVVSWSLIGIRKIKDKKEYENAEYIFSILDESYNKLKEISENENIYFKNEYKFEKYDGSIKNEERREYYYKKGRCKEVRYINGEICEEEYGKWDSEKSLNTLQFLNGNNKIGGWGAGEYISAKEYIERNIINNYSMRIFYNLSVMKCINYEVEERTIENKEYYVIKEGNIQDFLREIWINKNTMLPDILKTVTKDYITESKKELELNNVTDEDVKALDKDLSTREFDIPFRDKLSNWND